MILYIIKLQLDPEMSIVPDDYVMIFYCQYNLFLYEVCCSSNMISETVYFSVNGEKKTFIKVQEDTKQ